MILLEVTHSLTSAFTVSLVGGRESAREREKERTSLFWSRASCSKWVRLHNSGTPCRKRTQTVASDISNRYFFIYSALQKNCQVADCEIWLRSSSFWGNKFSIRGRPLQVKNRLILFMFMNDFGSLLYLREDVVAWIILSGLIRKGQ